MKRILVLSDSHSGLSFMRRCIRAVKPDVMIHLGDYFDDGETMAQENPNVRNHQVPGNCDRYRMIRYEPEVRCYPVGGVKFYMTHGHLHNVKTNRHQLLLEARKMDAQVVLYGHTHVPATEYFSNEDKPFYLFNPGSISSGRGSYGILTLTEGQEPLFSQKSTRFDSLMPQGD